MDQEELRRQLNELYADRKEEDPGYSWAKFAVDLARMTGRAGPYTKGFIYAVARGQPGYKITGELAEGLARLNAVRDGMDEFQARLQPVPSSVLSMSPIPPGAVVMGQARQCATPGCGLWFTSDNSRRRYCPRCRPPRPRP